VDLLPWPGRGTFSHNGLDSGLGFGKDNKDTEIILMKIFKIRW
jgi:hypothetical protein